MKSRLEEDLRIGDLEGLILDTFQVDSFQPKFCDEKDVAVVSFLVSQRESAVKLGDYITRGPFNFLNVEASSSPDDSGSYVVLAELDRSQEMFNTIDQLLHYIDQQVHIRDWHFKPYSSEKHLPWTRENFVRTVPQDPREFQSGKKGDSKGNTPPAASASRKDAAAAKDDSGEDAAAKAINYSLLARIVEREISKSSRSYFVEFQKQFRKVSKDSRRLLHHFKEIKTDHQHLIKQLDLHQSREKLALLREQQDIKRIRDLEDRLTYLLVAGPEQRKISVTDAGTPTIAIEPGDTATAEKESEEIVETQIRSDTWAPGEDAAGEQDGISGDGTVAEAEIVPNASEDATASSSGDTVDKPGQAGQKAAFSYESYGEDTEAILNAGEPAAPSDDSPVSEIFRQAMQASEQKNYPQAIEDFTRITEISPEEPRAYYNLAILYFRLADYEKAGQYANKAIDLGADGARKILNKAKAKQAIRSGRKAGATEQKSGDADDNFQSEPSRRHKRDAPISPAEDPLTGIEQQTVEIGSPTFAVPTSLDDETSADADQTGVPPSAQPDLSKEKGPLSSGGTGPNEPVVIDSEAPAAGSQDDDAPVAALPVDQEGPPVEEVSPADSSVPTITEEPLDIENMPTASLDDFIQAGADAQPPLDEQSVVATDQTERPPEAQEASGKEDAPALPDAEMPIDGSQVTAGDSTTAAPEIEAETEEIEVQPDPTTEVQPEAAAAMPSETVEKENAPEEQIVQSTEEPAQQDKSSPVVEADLFTRGLAASEKKNYAEALQLFTRFVELNPGQPRGFYNLAILHYRLKDFETARDMARKALDMGIGSAQKVYEKSQIRLAKERSIAMADNIENASTDTIFEELDTAAFETIDPSALEEIPVTDTVMPPPPSADLIKEVLPPPGPADPLEPSVDASEIESPTTDAAAQAAGGSQNAEAIPEFPVFTGDLAQQTGVSTDDAVADPAEEKLPEIDAMPIPDPAAVQDAPPAAADASEPPVPEPLPGGQLVEPDEAAAVQAAVEAESAAAPTVEQQPEPPKTKPPEKLPAEAGKPAVSEADPEALFAKGMKAYSSKNFGEAIEFFNGFIDLRPREPRGYYNLAIVQYRRRDYAAAKSNAEKAANLGARAARKILQKIKKKQLKSKASSSGPAAAGKKMPRKRRAAGKEKAARAKTRKRKPAPGKPPVPGSPADTISAPEPVESRKTGESIGDIADYDTATFDIAEVLGHDPVVWDADDMEEEVDTSEIQSPLIGGETGDDVIVFESATTADTPKSAAPGPGQAAGDPPGTAHRRDAIADRPVKKKKAKSAGSAEVPGSDVFALGLAASEKKEYLKAIRYFKQFTELLPNDPRGYYNLAVVSYRLKSYQTAREHAKRAQELGSKPAAKILTKLKSIKVAA